MNIRTKVKLSFVFVVTLLLFLGLISSVITYQIKENSTFVKNISNILSMQDSMNDILTQSTQINDLKRLEKLKTEFSEHENSFEQLRKEMSQINSSQFIGFFIGNLGKDKTIQQHLGELYLNEHTIELLYDEIFELEHKKLDALTVFDMLYPQEKNLRIEIEKIIFDNNVIEQIKALSNLRYYSKEMLYQYGNAETLQKWISPIRELFKMATQKELKEKLAEYELIATQMGENAIILEKAKIVENENILRSSDILDNNTKLSKALENHIITSAGGFIDRMRILQFSIGFVTVLFIIFLAVKVSRNVSLTMDEVEAKIEEGLFEVHALNIEIEETQKEIIFTMGSIGESRSKETGNHVKRVAEYCKILALHYGLDEQEAEMLKLSSPMHDIGKIAIPDAVLNKPGRFDEEERRIMDTHAMMGYEMLKHSNRPLLKMAAIVAKEHHEKWNGTGYPEQKSGDEIHIYGRITALADVFDALGSERVYKRAWDDEKIFALFKEERGKHFDPRLVDIFFEHLPEFLHVRNSMKD